jgi:hypothetical protein
VKLAFLGINMIEGQDYCFINPKEEADITHIRLLTGPYKDTLFKYGKVSFKEEFDQAHLLFAYYVLESPVMKPKKLESDSDFKQYAGDLLVEIMSSNLDEEMIDETGTDDTETPDLLGRFSP